MLHAPPTTLRTQRRFIARQRFNLLGALVATALLPFLLRAIILAHATVVTILLMTRLPYDRLALVAGFVAHIVWAYGLYLAVHRLIRHRIAIVPFGDVDRLKTIEYVDWQMMRRPSLDEAALCDGLVADFAADIPPEWEALLAEAAVQGRMVYQVKQLQESLTGRVSIEHLSENNFGSLVPARAYFHLKSAADFVLAVAVLPFLLPVLAAIALAIKLDSPGPVLFRQRRVGRAGVPFYMLKFRTMAHREPGEGIEEVITSDGDPRVTRI